jgi:hypothetical protein
MRRRLLPFLCEVPVVWSFVYLALGRILELIVLCCRSAKAKEIEILEVPPVLRRPDHLVPAGVAAFRLRW